MQDQNQLLHQKEVDEWKNSPVSKALFNILKLEAMISKEAIYHTLSNTNKFRDIDLEELAEFRGQANALERVLNIELFLRDVIKIEVKDEEVFTPGIDSDYQS